MGNYDQNDSEPEPRGSRVAAYVTDYLRIHVGLSTGELAFRLRIDKRDLRRLLNERSCGWRLEDALASYFGPDFVDAVFAPVVGDGRSIRERELEVELAAIAARREALERDRQARRRASFSPSPVVRLVDDQDRLADV